MPEPENTQIHVFAYFMCLGTSQGTGSNPKAFFFYKVLYNYFSKKKSERFVPKNDVPKNGFLIVFSKSDLGGGGYIFCEKKHTGICPCFSGNVSET